MALPRSLAHSASAPSLPESWSSALQQYERERRVDHFSIASPIRFDKQKMQENYQYNPLTGLYNDADREAAQRQLELRRVRGGANRVQTGYNIISGSADDPNRFHLQSPVHASGHKRVSQPHLRARDYNLINLTPVDRDAEKRINQQENEERRRRELAKEFHRQRGAVDKSSIERREYSIITGQYYSNHQERAKAEEEINRNEKLRMLYSNHAFNPLKQEFYDPNEEKMAKQQDGEKYRQLAEVKWAKLPESIRRNERRGYSIITPPPEPQRPVTVSSPLRPPFGVEGAIEDKPKSRLHINPNASANTLFPSLMSPTHHTFEAANKYRRQEAEAKELSRVLNRVSDHRFKIENDRGYNVINLMPLETKVERRKFESPTANQSHDGLGLKL